MDRRISDPKAYEKVVLAFRRQKKGITLSDVAAGTGLGLGKVKELVPLAADEYSARLEVTESGEILYSFPGGFNSRYRGVRAAFKRFLSSFSRYSSKVLAVLFKAWIMVMLVGYFLLFMAIALAFLFLSVAANSNSRGRRSGGGMYASANLFNLIIRLWFYSELFGGRRDNRWGGSYVRQPSSKGRPLNRAIFSFVFGESDPNQDRETLEKKALVSFIRKRRGVISLPELMIITGLPPQKAERLAMSLCAEFGGQPEATAEGTVVYRFEEILASGDTVKAESSAAEAVALSIPPSPLYKDVKIFSSNQGKMNFWFSLINGVNLLFGGYFLYNAVNTGRITQALIQNQGQGSNTIYTMVYLFLSSFSFDPLPVIQIALGIVPLVFSVLFWLIPLIRSLLLKRENNKIKLDNFRSFFFSRIWGRPEGFQSASHETREEDCRPQDLEAARESLLKEMASYSPPEVSVDEKQSVIYDFTELRREKNALEKYRLAIDPAEGETGKVIFDSGG